MSKKWALNPSWTFVVLIAIIYAIEALLWLPAMLQKNQLSVTGVLWSLLATIATVAIGLIFFHEHLSLTQFLGIAFALAAITMLNI